MDRGERVGRVILLVWNKGVEENQVPSTRNCEDGRKFTSLGLALTWTPLPYVQMHVDTDPFLFLSMVRLKNEVFFSLQCWYSTYTLALSGPNR